MSEKINPRPPESLKESLERVRRKHVIELDLGDAGTVRMPPWSVEVHPVSVGTI
jgi:hypothetical protein